MPNYDKIQQSEKVNHVTGRIIGAAVNHTNTRKEKQVKSFLKLFGSNQASITVRKGFEM